ncbi:LLM class flavin-dependent oxidoreductase [Pedococcus sp. NPDC057267]|uniref:LLM class flavin-dependent oxidoreductase n=1 Tax=Pedococcus sp. NPDC057267 TaxID=3346077 RepID=UPI003636CA6A
MTDYGHQLEFGIFPTPDASAADLVLEMSEAADVSGLDLVTVQDHPYNARHLDAWTLLSVVAARTTTVRVALNVANLPLRPPVVLARSAATLDLLSGGRVELGLGTGAFWDAIAAAGGPRRTPGEATTALEEAIAVIRGVWSGRGAVSVDGEHYRVKGLHSGPAPAHPVGIWLGAYKPRMLRLTGRLADGWLPSMGYAGPAELPAMNATIDEAARAAGRDPVAVRRLYNVDPGTSPEQLAELALEHGMSTFIVPVASVRDVQRFAAEVAPATRELVEDERTRRDAAPAGPVVTDTGRADASERGDAGGAADVGPGARESLATTATAAGAARASGEHQAPDAPPSRSTVDATAHEGAGAHLVEVHDGLRAELARLRDIVEQVVAGEEQAHRARNAINELTMRQNNWTLGAYCQQYCRFVTGHHGLEDRSIFPHLRRSDPALTPVLDRLEQEHLVIHDVLEQLDDALVGLVSGASGTPELQRVVDRLSQTLLEHLSFEEDELVPALDRYGFY